MFSLFFSWSFALLWPRRDKDSTLKLIFTILFQTIKSQDLYGNITQGAIDLWPGVMEWESYTYSFDFLLLKIAFVIDQVHFLSPSFLDKSILHCP